ncbi:glutamate receptor [Raphidocelis subcapitata]|uniref:Glutamate receptor n=1 Tax=Raphidocelis subcapitata TaxID=307507 RepID=A0A2V0NYC3_9CHLO|nr:glutamate receptor [Raphidocelis subcapitata]|eukprot:GBF92329.1 glutamate receptor [Raphidocelis subcapitata]
MPMQMRAASPRHRRRERWAPASLLAVLVAAAGLHAAAVAETPLQRADAAAEQPIVQQQQLALPLQPQRSRRLAQLLQILQQQQAEAEQAGQQAAEQPAEGAPPAESAAALPAPAESAAALPAPAESTAGLPAPAEESGTGGAAEEEPSAKDYQPPKPPPRKDNGIGGRVAQICVCETVPIIACLGREESEFDGYEYTLFKRVAAEIGWGRGDYTFKCIEDWDSMLDSLANNTGMTGFKILVSAEVYRLSFFVFLDAFNWKLWLAIILTCVFVGVAVWVLDPWARPDHMPSRQDYRFLGLRQRVWSALANSMSFSATDMGESHMAGNVIVLAFAFMMLVLVSLYTAVTSSNLTANRLTSSITGIYDLPGKKVATWEYDDYITDLKRKGVNATGLPWEGEADQIAMFDAVANGNFDALVLEGYVLDYGANSRCDVAVVGDMFNEYEAGMAFPANYSHPELIERINAALLLLKESGDVEELFFKYVNPPAPFCKRTMAAGQGTQIGFRDVVGLWVLLAGGVVAAIVIIIAARLASHGARRARPAIERAVSLVRGRSMSRATPLGLSELEGGLGGEEERNGKGRASSPGKQRGPSPDSGAEPGAGVDGGPASRKGARARRPAGDGGGGADGAGADAAAASGAAGHSTQLDALELEVLSALQRYRRAAMAVAAAGGAPLPKGKEAQE